MTMYRNNEGYSDPTAGQAMGSAMRDTRRGKYSEKHRKKSQKRAMRPEEYRGKAKVYVCSPYAGDVKSNRDAAIRYCRYVIDRGLIPIASHLMYPQVLRDGVPGERELGLTFGLELLALCDELWMFGSTVSPGMEQEIREARRLGKPLRYVEEVPER